MNPYTDVTKVANYLKRELTDQESLVLPMLADAATEYIDSELETTYQNVTESASRFFDGEGCEVEIDSCKTISSVQIVDDNGAILQTLAANEYAAYPINKTIKTSIRSRIGRFTEGIGNIKVTALFTSYDGKVPQSIVLAATMLVADYLQGDDQRIKSEETEGWRVAYDSLPRYTDRVADLIAPYRRLTL